ncbi:hypothetical protein PS2_022463 [Malus domestica]
MIDMCCKFEKGFKRDSGSENAMIRKRLHKKKAKKSKGTCFHCGKDERWKKKYRGLVGSKPLSNGEMVVRVGNGTKISTKAIGTYMLNLPSGEIHKMSKDGYIHPLGNDRMGTCECCLKGKMTKSPFTGKGERATEILGLIHTDVCGPMSTTSRGGFSYYITFTDDHSRFGYVYLMKYKSESFERFKEFKNEVEKQTGKQIKILRSDRGGEYLSNEFLDYLKECGIISQWTPPGTPQLNGVSERRNRTLMNMVRSMMSSADLPVTFWGYALYTAAYLLNRVPSKSVSQTPYEIWHGRKPSLKHIKIWGCEAYVKKLEVTKLEARSVGCYFVGYPKENMGYEFYHPDDQKVFVARTAKFLEDEFVLKGTISKLMEINEINNEP